MDSPKALILWCTDTGLHFIKWPLKRTQRLSRYNSEVWRLKVGILSTESYGMPILAHIAKVTLSAFHHTIFDAIHPHPFRATHHTGFCTCVWKWRKTISKLVLKCQLYLGAASQRTQWSDTTGMLLRTAQGNSTPRERWSLVRPQTWTSQSTCFPNRPTIDVDNLIGYLWSSLFLRISTPSSACFSTILFLMNRTR